MYITRKNLPFFSLENRKADGAQPSDLPAVTGHCSPVLTFMSVIPTEFTFCELPNGKSGWSAKAVPIATINKTGVHSYYPLSVFFQFLQTLNRTELLLKTKQPVKK
jgi:hypothetical protein